MSAQVRVVRGEPDDVEVAALVAGLAFVTAADEPDDVAPIDEWTNRSRVLRGNGAATAQKFGGRSGRHHVDAWRWSLRS